jgi:hypothetical protein
MQGWLRDPYHNIYREIRGRQDFMAAASRKVERHIYQIDRG